MKYQRDQEQFDWDAYNRVEPADPMIDPADKVRVTKAAHRILEMLREGPKTNVEMATVTPRYGARIHDLRKAGYQIVKARVPGGHGVFQYRLIV